MPKYKLYFVCCDKSAVSQSHAKPQKAKQNTLKPLNNLKPQTKHWSCLPHGMRERVYSPSKSHSNTIIYSEIQRMAARAGNRPSKLAATNNMKIRF